MSRSSPPPPLHLVLARHRNELGRARTLTPGEVVVMSERTEPPVITRMGYQLREHFASKRPR